VDIAGLVRGASKGEGLGNQFWRISAKPMPSSVVRCFEDENIITSKARSIRCVILKRFKSNWLWRIWLRSKNGATKPSKREIGRQSGKSRIEILDKIQPVLEEGRPARAVELTKEEKAMLKTFSF
jgi:ribosome-binding ATPase YchF (GTP1/OBG family)